MTSQLVGETESVQVRIFVLSLILLTITLGAEAMVLFMGYPTEIPEIVVGRVLGLFDAIALAVLNYNYGSSSGSLAKTAALERSMPVQ